MAKESKNDDLLEGSNPVRPEKMSFSIAELTALVTAAVEASTVKSAEVSAKIIAEALRDAQKPYRDPKQDLNEEAFRTSTRELEQRIRRDLKASQETCPHKQGCNQLSEYQSQLSSFVTHQTDTGMVIGICTNCQKWIFSDRLEDRKFFADKSANKMSKAGQRVFINSAEPQRKGRPIGYEEETAAVAQG